MNDGITVRILGDFGPFSRMGKSIGYEITIGDSVYLFDCGAPLFQQIGGTGLKEIKGIFLTHCHDDHKRWFTDLALFHRYSPASYNINLVTSEDVYNDLLTSSGPSLDRSLSEDSKHIINIPMNEYLENRIIGPRARYRIVSKNEGNGKTGLFVIGPDGEILGPDKAKIVISPETQRARLLFKDPEYNEWVEPESFYPFSSNIFYEEDKNIFSDSEGFTIEAVKSPVWHGIPNIGLKIKTDKESLIFSSDTINNRQLWEQLSSEKRTINADDEFISASVIYGDINDYIERAWSRERYNDALNAFIGSNVIHDLSYRKSIVHTDYEKLSEAVLEKENALLTHSPDVIVSEWKICSTDKIYRFSGDGFLEVVGDKLYPLNADIYYKDAENFYVGYRNENGNYSVYEENGLLSISLNNGCSGNFLYKVSLYEDISGKYFPRLEEKGTRYVERDDGQVELVKYSENGSRGMVVKDHRESLLELNGRAFTGDPTNQIAAEK